MVKPQMQPRKPMLDRFYRTALRLVSLTALLILVSIGASCSKVPISPIIFGHLGVSTPTNANSVCVTLTNQSDSVVSYLACPLQVRSNGIWSGPTLPPRQKLTRLLPRQSGVVVVDAALTNENTRVPILWGYVYDAPATRWPRLQELTEDLAGRIRGRGGSGFLYTNYLTNLRL